MAVTADRVIVELEAKLDRYEANVRRAEQKFDSATRAIANDAKRMEREISRSTSAIGNQFRTLAATVGAAFSAQQILAMADSYTRFTNQLRVAGLEGTALAGVQEQLFTVAQRNGVELETLGVLYSKAAQNQRELSASSADVLVFNRAVAASLRISGTSAESARGPLLQLGQALGSPRVMAEEFNSVLEGMPTLLREASKYIEGTGGTLAGLTRKIKDVNGPGVSNIELFRAITQAMGDLEAKANSTQLTISAAFTNLTNALTKYVGEADRANGATALITAALDGLANNLDTVTEALAVLSALLLGRFVAGLAAGATATGLASTAIFAMQARAVGAATTMEALALTSATAGRAMLAAFGGPIGLAVTALALGIGYLATRTDEASAAAVQAEAQAQRTATALDIERKVTDQLTSAKGRERAAQLAAIQASRARAAQAIQTAKALVQEAKASLAAERVKLKRAENLGLVGDVESGAGGIPDPFARQTAKRNAQASPIGRKVTQLETNIRKAESGIADAEAFVAAIDKGIAAANAPVKLASTGVSAGGGAKRGAGGGGAGAKDSGRSAEDIAASLDSDLRALGQRALSAQLQLTTGAEERAELESRMLELQRIDAIANVQNNKDYSEAQKKRLLTEIEAGIFEERALIEARRKAQLAEEAAALEEQKFETQTDALQAEYDLAETAAERRKIAREIIDLEYRHRRAVLETVLASEAASEADKALARAKLAALDAEQTRDEQKADRQNESPFEKYRRGLDKSTGEIQEQAEQWVIDELEGIQNALSGAIKDKLGIKDPILSGIIDLFIEQVIMKPLADALGSAMGGGGGGTGGLFAALGSVLGSVLGAPTRASGGHVMGGKLYRVNDGGGIEGFRPSGSGQIIPLGRMARGGGGGVSVYQTVKVDARNSVTPDGFAEHIVARTRQETALIVAEASKRVNKAVPGRMAQFQRDGT